MAASSVPSHTNQRITLAVDAVIFTVERGDLKVLLIQMKKAPFEGRWAFPGGLIDHSETTEHAARRVLKTQTGVNDVYLEQLATFDEPTRDPIGRVVSVAYFALVPRLGVELHTTEKYADVRWWNVSRLPKLAYDHGQIAQVALARLRAKLEYTNVVWSLLDEEFTLTELQRIYEVILGRTLDKRNFRKKLLGLGLLASTKKRRKGEAFRPAELYRFKQRKPMMIEML